MKKCSMQNLFTSQPLEGITYYVLCMTTKMAGIPTRNLQHWLSRSLQSHIHIHELDFFCEVRVRVRESPSLRVRTLTRTWRSTSWYQVMSAKFTHKWTSFLGEIGAHPRMKFVLGYVYVCRKDGGDTYTQTKCDLSNILLSLNGLFEKHFSLSVFNSYTSIISKFERPKMDDDLSIFTTPSIKIWYL